MDRSFPALQAHCRRAAFYLAWASAVSILVSIAVSQILLAMGIVALLVSGQRLRFPPVKLPLTLFFLATVAAVLASGDPRHGLPQIRKFYVFLIVVLVFNTFRTVRQIRALVLGWTAAASVSGLFSLLQFVRLVRRADAAQLKDYGYFLYNRITGFSSHWMTFGGEEMIVLLALLALLFFSIERKGKSLGLICAPILLASLVLGLTRSVFLLGLPLGAAYLVWHWKRWLLLVIPPLALVAFLFSPMQVRERAASVFAPHHGMDSNTHRVITLRTGLAMIKAHPWLGLGPEEIALHFNDYVPPDVPRPLPPGWYGHLHNIYLQYAAERGIPGMLMMMWFIAKVLYDCLRSARRSTGDARFVFLGVVAVTIAILAEGFFEYNLGDSEVLTMFLTMVACAYVALTCGVSRVPGNSAKRTTKSAQRTDQNMCEHRLPEGPHAVRKLESA
ncbi:MAG: O-antigen ligase family protein [Bryobacteraceae bacterium]|jgi:O-antigen ligase